MQDFVSHESWYKCNCGNEVMLVRQYNNKTNGKRVREPQVEIGIYKGNPLKLSFLQKIKVICEIIFHGDASVDQMYLDAGTCMLLSTQLRNLFGEVEVGR